MESSRSTREPQPWSYSRSLIPTSFAWPPRSYQCSFCRREFRSAQALGGHMNVHRRDRARLRHGSPPPPHPAAAAANPNPRWAAAAAAIPNLNYPPPPAGPPPAPPMAPPPSLYRPQYSRSGKSHERSASAAAKAKARELEVEVNLELGVGVGVQCCMEEDGLDLELRLGYS